MSRTTPGINGLYVITPDELNTAVLLNKVRLALLGGARILQFRSKHGDASLRTEQARELRKLTSEFNVLYIVNDDPALAKTVAADGVHLGEEDVSIEAARKLLGQDRIVGASCYNQPLLAQKAEQEGADYVAFGAFFHSDVKPDAVVSTPEMLRQARRKLSVPIVAIGGITVQNGRQLIAAGASTLAVISSVFSAEDIRQAAQELTNLFDKV